MKHRFHHIDLMKVLGIIFVVFYHSTLYSFECSGRILSVEHMRYFLRTILSTCVPLFFFIHGYLLFNRPLILKDHIRKMLRYCFLVIIWGVLSMLIYALVRGEDITLSFILQKVMSLDIEYGINFLWFLCTLVAIYTLYPLFKSLYDSNIKYFAYCTVIITVLTIGIKFANFCLTYLNIVFHDVFGSFTFSQPIIELMNPFRGTYGYAFSYFCIGGLCYKLEDKMIQVPRFKRNMISCIGIFLSCFGLFATGMIYSSKEMMWDVVWEGYDTVFTLINVILIYVLSLNFQSDNLMIRLISRNTLGIYLTHGILIRCTRDIVSQQPYLCTALGSLIYAVAIIIVCFLICYFLKKIPIIRRLL